MKNEQLNEIKNSLQALEIKEGEEQEDYEYPFYKMSQNAIDMILWIAKDTQRRWVSGEPQDYNVLNNLWTFACDVSAECCPPYSGGAVEVIE